MLCATTALSSLSRRIGAHADAFVVAFVVGVDYSVTLQKNNEYDCVTKNVMQGSFFCSARQTNESIIICKFKNGITHSLFVLHI